DLSSLPPTRSTQPPAQSSLPPKRSTLPPVSSLPPPGSSLPPPPRSLPPPPQSYAPVEETEFEEDIVLEDDVDDDAPELSIEPARDSAVELRDSEFELRASSVELRDAAVELRDSEVELRDSAVELHDSEVELSDDAVIDDEEFEDDVIEDDALDMPSGAHEAAPAAARHAYDSEELPTQPHIDSNRFPLSMLGSAGPTPEPESDPRVADVLLGEVRGLEDVPPEGQAILAREARVERLNEDEEISSFGLAL